LRRCGAGVPVEECLAEAGPSGDDCPVAGSLDAAIQRREVAGSEAQDAVRGRLEVVQEADRCATEPASEARGLDAPGKIGGGDDVTDDRTGDAERRGADG
jgi:hypothetical protein